MVEPRQRLIFLRGRAMRRRGISGSDAVAELEACSNMTPLFCAIAADAPIVRQSAYIASSSENNSTLAPLILV